MSTPNASGWRPEMNAGGADDSTTFTGCVSNASCKAGKDRPCFGWVGTSSTRRFRDSSKSRKPKWVGDSRATTSPGLVTARRQRPTA